MYFDEEDLKEKKGESNKVKSDDENDSSDSEEEIPDESERKVSPMMPIISPVTA